MSRVFVILIVYDIKVLDWEIIFKIEILVILMGVKNLGEIVY